MVTQELPYPGKRRLMAAIASKEAQAELQQYLVTERGVMSRLKQAYHRLHHSYEMLGVMERSRDLLLKFIQLAEIRYSVGKAMQQDILKAQTQVAIMETRIVKMRNDAAMAKAEINAILHRPIDAPLERPLHELPRELTASLADLVKDAESTWPGIAREQKMAEARQFSVSLARKNFYPDFAVSGGYFNMGTMPDMYQFRLDIKVPVRRTKQRAALAEQVQSLEQSRRSYEAAAHEARWRVNELYLTAQAAWRLISLYRETVMPHAELTVESALASFEAGTLESMAVLMNVMTRVEQEERYHEEMLDFFLAVTKLEEITGRELL
jgi:outer membrane protein TolC